MTEAPPEDVEAVGLQLRACEAHRDDLLAELRAVKDYRESAEARLCRALEEVESLKKALRISEGDRDDWQATAADLLDACTGTEPVPARVVKDARAMLRGTGTGLRTRIAELEAALEVAKLDLDAMKESKLGADREALEARQRLAEVGAQAARQLEAAEMMVRAANAARDTWKREAKRLEAALDEAQRPT